MLPNCHLFYIFLIAYKRDICGWRMRSSSIPIARQIQRDPNNYGAIKSFSGHIIITSSNKLGALLSTIPSFLNLRNASLTELSSCLIYEFSITLSLEM